jgi:hypothetical protein
MNMKNVAKKADSLFKRVATILEQARKNVLRSVNSNMVIAYWLIGREIVQEIQGGKNRAGYGEKVIEELSEKLSQKYGRGFSTTNLRYFRTFYLTYSSRSPEIRQIGSGELAKGSKRQTQSGILKDMENAVERKSEITGFSPYLGQNTAK